MPRTLVIAFLVLLGCGEWVDAPVGRVSCSFRGSFFDLFFEDWLPAGRKPVKFAAGNNGNILYILDNSSGVHSYRRDNLYDCTFEFERSHDFIRRLDDVFYATNGFYVQEGQSLKFMDESEACYASDGVFAINRNELGVGGNLRIETWSIATRPCVRGPTIASQRILALGSANGEYYAAEGDAFATEPANLTFYRNRTLIRREPLSTLPGNEKNFCSADRITANNHGIYLLDKKCGKIGVFHNDAVWRKTIRLDSLGIRNPLDITAAEHSYIFILHDRGVDRVNVF
jgi:hypothetical protein